MLINHNGLTIELLGDPHLGRPFVHGVPLHRRGEREHMVWKDFFQSLETDADIHVCMGDLFDKWSVSYDVIVKAAHMYTSSAIVRPKTQFYILKGNHDWTRDLERKSAFDVFKMIVSRMPNIHVVDEPKQVGDLLFYPWHPTAKAADEVAKFKDVSICFGHFDTEFGDHNMVPTGCGIPTIYTGHVHKPDEFTRDGTKVHVVGSMQPYAHGEEADDTLYVTVSLDDLKDLDTTNKCVRVILEEGEVLDDEIDCLQLTIKKKGSSDVDDTPTVTLGDFDMDTLFRQAFQNAGVTPEITEQVLEQYHTKRFQNGA